MISSQALWAGGRQVRGAVKSARRQDKEGKMEQALALAEARHGGALVAGSST
jgi:hypothetical protein